LPGRRFVTNRVDGGPVIRVTRGGSAHERGASGATEEYSMRTKVIRTGVGSARNFSPPAMRPRQVVTLIGASEWTRLGSFLDAATRDLGLRQWHEYRASCVERAEELMVLPARHDALARGR
jgi:hypothetical protein